MRLDPYTVTIEEDIRYHSFVGAELRDVRVDLEEALVAAITAEGLIGVTCDVELQIDTERTARLGGEWACALMIATLVFVIEHAAGTTVDIWVRRFWEEFFPKAVERLKARHSVKRMNESMQEDKKGT